MTADDKMRRTALRLMKVTTLWKREGSECGRVEHSTHQITLIAQLFHHLTMRVTAKIKAAPDWPASLFLFFLIIFIKSHFKI